MDRKFIRIFFTAAAMTALSTAAYAEGFDVRHFSPIAGSEGVFSVESSKTLGHLDYDVKFMADYANTPLQYTAPSLENASLQHQFSMVLSGAIGFLDCLEAAISVPFAVNRYSSNFAKDDMYRNGIKEDIPSGKGTVGDIQVRVKGTILKREDYHGFGLGAGVILSMPTGSQNAYIGSPTVTGRPYIVMDYEIGPVEMMLNAGFTFRDKTVFMDYTLEHGFNYGFGINYHVLPDWLDLRGEIFGETPLSSNAAKGRHNSAEFLAGAKLYTPIGLNLTAGAGTGIGDGVRNPLYRVLFGVEFAPTNRDSDGDGIYDREDACPEIPGTIEFEGCPNPDTDEDKWCDAWIASDEMAAKFQCTMTDSCPDLAGTDDFEGCPAPDSDNDGWCDAWITDQETANKYSCKMTDQCPDIAGTDDFEGCPAPDSDNDGWCDAWITDQKIADKYSCKMTDRCPELAGIDEFSGCPDADPDGDGLCSPFVDELGVFDLYFCSGKDMCPADPEDFDNFEDEDGCPDPDNDRDGICDPWVAEQGLSQKYADICMMTDKCPDEPETINGYKDTDGCPDKGKQLVFVHEDKIEIKDKIYFDNNKAVIKKKSYSLLNQLAQTIMADRSIKHVDIEGHTDDTGKYEHNIELSYQRASSVVEYLVKAGVSRDRLTPKGYGPDKPLVPEKTKKARALNRRVEFVITDRKK